MRYSVGRCGWLRAIITHTGELVWLNLEVAEAAQALLEHAVVPVQYVYALCLVCCECVYITVCELWDGF